MKLNLGCGARPLKGYLNIDAPLSYMSDPAIKADKYCNIEDLSFDSETIDGIKMESVFEHFPRHVALFLMRRFYKWLKPNGWVSIVVPDTMYAFERIKSAKDMSTKMFFFRCIFGPQDTIQYGTHFDGFDDDKLKETFKAVGFNTFNIRHNYGNRPNIYFTAAKQEPFLQDDTVAEQNIKKILRMYARGRKTDFMINNWITYAKKVLKYKSLTSPDK